MKYIAVRRVPGVKRYRSMDQGLRVIGRSPELGAEMLDQAQRVAGNAEAVGRSTYSAEQVGVRAGHNNEFRQGARVYESDRDYRDTRDAILLRTVDAMVVKPE